MGRHVDPAKMSPAEILAMLPIDEQNEMLAEMDAEKLLYDWNFWGRPNQHAPTCAWNIWLIMAGRGYGKTRAGAEWVRAMAMKYPGCRIALVGRTAADTIGVMINGDSGIIAISPPGEKPEYKVSRRELVWPNGSVATTFSSEEPDQLRGPQFHFAWADEAAAWKFVKDASGLNAWDNLRIATRLSYRDQDPQIIATTTPKRTPFMVDLLAEADKFPEMIKITRGSTYENEGNLATSYLNMVTGLYEGTAIAVQELEGEMLEELDGFLWTMDLINEHRTLSDRVPSTPLRIVAVDPSVAENPKDECGIVVVGATNDRRLEKRHAYVLDDASLKAPPDIWVKEVVRVAKKWNAPVVAETNNGGALIKNAIRAADSSIQVYTVTASRSKVLRAEPVILPYQQGRVHHWGHLPELEDQMTTWLPEVSKGKSPDRLDALVWGLTALLVSPPKGFGKGKIHFGKNGGPGAGGVRLPTGIGTGLYTNR